MKVSLKPSGRFSDGQIHTYVADLATGATAMLTEVPSKGWELIIRDATGTVHRRGLFATVHDARMLLESESSARPAGPAWPESQRGAQTGTGDRGASHEP
jgi:hypothetical protein